MANQPHRNTNEPAGWYPHDDPAKVGLWYWNGRKWTGEHVPPLFGEGKPCEGS